MKKLSLLLLAIVLAFQTFAQMSEQDSTVQTIGYWAMNEKQNYEITHNKFKLSEGDTTYREVYSYHVNVCIVDSTEQSYTIDWSYSDFHVQSDNELVLRVLSMSKDMTVRIVTDEYGAFQEVVNWKDIRKVMKKSAKRISKELKDIPNADKLFKDLMNNYISKEAIEAAAIDEIHQFYSFHGGRYEYAEDNSAEIKVPNMYGGEPFDAELNVWLDEFDTQEWDYVMRMYQVIDEEQLSKVVKDQLTKMSFSLGGEEPKFDADFKVSNETWLASRIHNTGWVIYSIKTREVHSGSDVQIDEIIIDLL